MSLLRLTFILIFGTSIFAQEAPLSPDALYSSGLAAMLPGNPDYAKAAEFFRKAADRGLPRAQRSLGEFYRDGRGVPKDLKEALKLFRKAADRGDALAQNNLGLMYGAGLGVKKNEKAAVKWFKKAAEGGDPSGQLNLGVMYANGRGVSRNPQEALRWYRAAADQGSPLAQFALGSIFERGFVDIPRNRVEAITWYTKALQQGFEGARAPLIALRNSADPPLLLESEAAASLLTPIVRAEVALARSARVRGDVAIEILVDTQGLVKSYNLLSGHALLNQAAIEAVLPLRYKPHVVNGQPSEFITVVTIKYDY